MRATPLTATIGSEIDDVDLTSGLSPQLADDLYELLLDRAVLIFRNQHPSSETHLALGEAWGPLAPRHPLYPHPDGHERIMIIRNDETTKPENETWHSDMSFRADPPFVSLLHGVVIPPAGGDTLWADMRAVHDALAPELRTLFEKLEAEHTMEHGFAFLRETDHEDRVTALNAREQQANIARHPIIKQHPVTGRGLVYVNESFTSHIPGLARNQGEALLKMLYDLTRNPSFQLRLRWSEGTLAVWDNWATQHFACGDHYPQNREVRRVTVLSDWRSGGFDGKRPQAAE